MCGRRPPDSASVLTPGALSRIRELQGSGEPDLLTEMIEAFLEAAPGHVAQMTDALARGDADGLAHAAHSMKSGAAYLGADELQQLCLESRHAAAPEIPLAATACSIRCALCLNRCERPSRQSLSARSRKQPENPD